MEKLLVLRLCQDKQDSGRERERERESGLRYKEADETKALSYESGATKTAQLDAQYGP